MKKINNWQEFNERGASKALAYDQEMKKAKESGRDFKTETGEIIKNKKEENSKENKTKDNG